MKIVRSSFSMIIYIIDIISYYKISQAIKG